MMAEHVAGVEGIRANGGAAAPAGRAKMVQPLQVAALAFPVADGIVDELEVADATEIRDRKHRVEDRLQADVLALVGQQIHLQEALIGRLLNLDQVRDGDRGLDLGKINSFGGGAALLNIHSYTPDGRRTKAMKRSTVPNQRRLFAKRRVIEQGWDSNFRRVRNANRGCVDRKSRS